MGKGKGSPEFWVAKVKPGRIMFEMDGVPESLAREAFELAAAKLPIPVKFVTRPAYLPVRAPVVYEAPPVEDLEEEAAEAEEEITAEAETADGEEEQAGA